MNWLKGLGISLKVAVAALLMALTVMAAQRHKATSRQWQQKAIDVENDNIETGALTVEAANTQAKLHDNIANDIKRKAKMHVAKMGGKDKDVASILNDFRASS